MLRHSGSHLGRNPALSFAILGLNLWIPAEERTGMTRGFEEYPVVQKVLIFNWLVCLLGNIRGVSKYSRHSNSLSFIRKVSASS